ncbi:hypothetical protein O181_077181 [Austropuccinia psidii MF-1]|uniref:Integrase catalytic domain-containing protein n=1 Tax=Austropuccinia psidii MF-1 TaxID=1389203 RepID=A0A9Q3FBU4_9BASI|nr:hypothetical protein [Austropuccinia psidii MF-1]
MDLPPSSYHDSLEELWDEEEEPEEIETVMNFVPPVYHQDLDVFSKVKSEKLPPHRPCYHHIELEGSLPAVWVIYSLSNPESDTLRAYISTNVEKGFIRPSSSSTGAPVLSVKKKDGGLRFCVDYCKLNAVTRKNKYPVPPINQLLNVFNGSSIFSKTYLHDDIMVFSKSEEEHVTHVSTVLSILRANNLFAKASKCLFHVTSVEYLGYVVSFECLKMDQEKVQKIFNWPPPRNLKALQSFLGFANFYRRFIKNYSKKISSLTSFLKKDSCFPLNEEALRQFHKFKEAFTISPILSHFDPSLHTIVETDASDYALGAVLSQISDSGKHPIAFDGRKLLPAELNYKIHDKELLGIVWALKSWRAFLLSLSSSFEVLTDNSSLQYFMSSNILTRYSLSRRDNVYPERGEDLISKNTMNYQKIIKQDEIQASKFFAVMVEVFSNFIESIQKALWQNSQYSSILQDLGKGKSVQDYSLDSSSQLLLFKDWVVVPNDPTIQHSILQKSHDSPLAGNPGQEKTLKIVKQDFHLSRMTKFIKDHVSSCQQCSRNKNIHHKNFGLLKPLPIPNGPWICLSMDFITQLPLSNSFDSILVIVERFAKMAVFIPTMSSITSLDLAHLFIKNIFSKHGLPSSIQLKISRDLSTAYHPETDGQTERVDQILEQYLWMYVSYHQDY